MAPRKRKPAPSARASGRSAGPRPPARPGSPASGRPRVARPAAQRLPRALERSRWWQGPGGIAAVVVGLAVVVGAFVVLSRQPGATTAPSPATATPSASLLASVTGLDPSVWESVGAGSVKNPLIRVAPSSPALTSGTRPEVLYVGADFCPYCAAQRWSMIVALSRFGSFSNLHLTTSATDDIDGGTNTFSFYNSTYTSSYLAFASVEETDNQRNPQQTPSAAQQSVLDTFDAAPYVAGNAAGGIPFLDIGGRYLASSSGYDPALLAGRSWTQIGAALSNARDPITQAIVGNANYLTAAICQVTGGQPGSVCNTPAISALSSQATALTAVG